MLSISRLGNQYFQSTMPWKLSKSADPADKTRAATVVGMLHSCVCFFGGIVQ